MNKTFTGFITKLEDNQIFVFGSNTEGRHGAGTALIARQKYGAKYGQAKGIQGKSYALITTDLTKKYRPSVDKSIVESNIKELYDYASLNLDKEFLIAYTASNKNLSGFTGLEFAEMFGKFDIPSNIIFEDELYALILSNQKK